MALHNSHLRWEDILFFMGCLVVIPLSILSPYAISIGYTISYISVLLGYAYHKDIKRAMFRLFDKIAACFGLHTPPEIDEDVMDRIREVDNSLIQRQLGITPAFIGDGQHDLETGLNQTLIEEINELFHDAQRTHRIPNARAANRVLCR
jgi:hypothetical protein